MGGFDDVCIRDITSAYGVVNLAGPDARKVLERVCLALDDPLPVFGGEAILAGDTVVYLVVSIMRPARRPLSNLANAFARKLRSEIKHLAEPPARRERRVRRSPSLRRAERGEDSFDASDSIPDQISRLDSLSAMASA